MNREHFIDLYREYLDTFIDPVAPSLDLFLEEWSSEKFWMSAREGSEIIVPKPIYRMRKRVKRGLSAWDKLHEKSANLDDIELVSLHDIRDILGVRAVVYLPSSYPLVHAAIGRSEVVEIHPSYPPKCYLPREMIQRLGMGVEDFDMRDVKESGYGSIHYQLRFKNDDGRVLPSFELQVRTILLEAWGEIEHKLNYKSRVDSETTTAKQLRVIADMLRAVDENFDIVHDRARYLRQRSTVPELRDSDMLDDAALASLLDAREVPVFESSMARVRGILAARGIVTVGEFRSRVSPKVVQWVREGAQSISGENTLDAVLLVSVVADLPADPTRESVREAVQASSDESDLNKRTRKRLFEPYVRRGRNS